MVDTHVDYNNERRLDVKYHYYRYRLNVKDKYL